MLAFRMVLSVRWGAGPVFKGPEQGEGVYAQELI